MSYSQISSHRSMVFDEHRNELYAKAIHKLVTPDSVVLDLGAGMGILGLIAAKAGAKRVYFVEPEPVVRIAMDVARANGLADKIIILQGRIEDVVLPEKVDLILSVFTGNLLYSEDLLPSLFYARDRYLKPGGKLIPDCAELWLAPVSAPEVHEKYIAQWSQPNQGLDYAPARRFAANELLWLSRDECKAEKLAPGALMTTIDLASETHADCQSETPCHIEVSGICHGLLAWIRLRLSDEWLSSDLEAPEVHWSPVMLPLDAPLPMKAGEDVELSLQRPAHGDWTWAVKTPSLFRRHSTFMARADGLQRLRKLAPDARPMLAARGETVLHVLTLMQQGKCNQEIAESLLAEFPNAFASIEEAMQRVQSLALRYGRDDNA